MNQLAVRENPELPTWALVALGLAAGLGAAWLVSRAGKPEEDALATSGAMPYGKGIYVYDLDDAQGPDDLAERLRWLDMDWVALQTHRIENNQLLHTDTAAKRNAHIAAIRQAGIAVWFWGWPKPGRSQDFANVAAQMISAHNPAGFIVNAEKGWRKSDGAAATAMMATIRAALGSGRGLGFTSFGGANVSVPNFPWEEFARYADFGSPQIYDRNNTYGPGYPPASMERWAKLFGRVSPIWSAGPSKTAGMMDAIQERTPLPYPSASWWTYASALASSSRANAVRSYSLSESAPAVA